MQETSIVVTGSTSFNLVQSQLRFSTSSSDAFGHPTDNLKPGVYLEKLIKYTPGNATAYAASYSMHLLMDNVVDPDIESGEEIIQSTDINKAGNTNERIRLYFRSSNHKLYSISVLYEYQNAGYIVDLLEAPAIDSYFIEIPIDSTFKSNESKVIASLLNSDNVKYYLVTKQGADSGKYRIALITADYLEESLPLNAGSRTTPIGVYHLGVDNFSKLEEIFSRQNLSESVESLYSTMYDKFTTR